MRTWVCRLKSFFLLFFKINGRLTARLRQQQRSLLGVCALPADVSHLHLDTTIRLSPFRFITFYNMTSLRASGLDFPPRFRSFPRALFRQEPGSAAKAWPKASPLQSALSSTVTRPPPSSKETSASSWCALSNAATQPRTRDRVGWRAVWLSER